MKLARAAPRERGNALIEFALSFFLIFAIFSGIFQFAYSFYVYNTLVVAVRQGARYASIKPYDSTTTTPTASFQNAVQNMSFTATRIRRATRGRRCPVYKPAMSRSWLQAADRER